MVTGRLVEQICLPERVNRPGHKQMSVEQSASVYCKIKAH